MVGIFACRNLEWYEAQAKCIGGGAETYFTPPGRVTPPLSSQRSTGLAGGLFDLDDFAALVIAALLASAVRQLALVAVGTFGQRLRCQVIVGASLGGTRLRVAPFWIRHDKLRNRP